MKKFSHWELSKADKRRSRREEGKNVLQHNKHTQDECVWLGEGLQGDGEGNGRKEKECVLSVESKKKRGSKQ